MSRMSEVHMFITDLVEEMAMGSIDLDDTIQKVAFEFNVSMLTAEKLVEDTMDSMEDIDA